MTDDEIITLLRRGDPVSHIVRMGPTLHRVRKLQATWAPETRKKQARPMLLRRRVTDQRVTIRVPPSWEWVEVSRETDANGNVVRMKVEVSE